MRNKKFVLTFALVCLLLCSALVLTSCLANAQGELGTPADTETPDENKYFGTPVSESLSEGRYTAVLSSDDQVFKRLYEVDQSVLESTTVELFEYFVTSDFAQLSVNTLLWSTPRPPLATTPGDYSLNQAFAELATRTDLLDVLEADAVQYYCSDFKTYDQEKRAEILYQILQQDTVKKMIADVEAFESRYPTLDEAINDIEIIRSDFESVIYHGAIDINYYLTNTQTTVGGNTVGFTLFEK